MSATAVPLRPVKKGSVLKLWLGLAILAILAGAFAWWGTSALHYKSTASGLQYRQIEAGEGPSPAATDFALVTYTGTLEDGTVFDSNERAPMPVNGVVPGFSEGLQMMSKGATYRFRLPPQLAYGPEGRPPVIPPNSTLDFEVTLVDFQTLTPKQLQQLQMMQMMQQQQQGGGQMGPPPGAGEAGPEGPPSAPEAGAPPGGR